MITDQVKALLLDCIKARATRPLRGYALDTADARQPESGLGALVGQRRVSGNSGTSDAGTGVQPRARAWAACQTARSVGSAARAGGGCEACQRSFRGRARGLPLRRLVAERFLIGRKYS